MGGARDPTGPAVGGGAVNRAVVLRRSLGGVDAALSEGRISFDHAAAMARAANPRIETEVAAKQDRWVALAQRSPFRAWSSALAARVELLDQDGGFDPDRERARNRLRLAPCGDAVAISGELVGPLAAAFVQQIEAKADELFRRAVADHAETPDLKVPKRPTLRAEALGELTRLGGTVDPQSTPGPVVDLALVIEECRPDVVHSADRDLTIATRWPSTSCAPPSSPSSARAPPG